MMKRASDDERNVKVAKAPPLTVAVVDKKDSPYQVGKSGPSYLISPHAPDLGFIPPHFQSSTFHAKTSITLVMRNLFVVLKRTQARCPRIYGVC